MNAVVIALLLAAPLAGQVKYEEILKSPVENWLTYSGDYASTRYSPLRQINRDNVGSLIDGRLIGLHAATGNVLWDREYAPSNQGYFSTSAPLAAKGLLVVGVGGGGAVQRPAFGENVGFLDADPLIYVPTGNPWPDFFGGE